MIGWHRSPSAQLVSGPRFHAHRRRRRGRCRLRTDRAEALSRHGTVARRPGVARRPDLRRHRRPSRHRWQADRRGRRCGASRGAADRRRSRCTAGVEAFACVASACVARARRRHERRRCRDGGRHLGGRRGPACKHVCECADHTAERDASRASCPRRSGATSGCSPVSRAHSARPAQARRSPGAYDAARLRRASRIRPFASPPRQRAHLAVVAVVAHS